MFPTIENVPHLSKNEMKEVDRLMVEKYRISLIQMMENAGRNLATVAKALFLQKDLYGKRIAVFAGRGGNGGGAVTAARWLHMGGAYVQILLSVPAEKVKGIPGVQLEIADKLGIFIRTYSAKVEDHISFDLIIDGVIGYGIEGEPRDISKEMIDNINSRKTRTLSLDIPSGIDPDRGAVYESAVKADVTMTLALPKRSFLKKETGDFTGRIFLADISVPPQLYREDMNISDTERLFDLNGIVELK